MTKVTRKKRPNNKQGGPPTPKHVIEAVKKVIEEYKDAPTRVLIEKLREVTGR